MRDRDGHEPDAEPGERVERKTGDEPLRRPRAGAGEHDGRAGERRPRRRRPAEGDPDADDDRDRERREQETEADRAEIRERLHVGVLDPVRLGGRRERLRRDIREAAARVGEIRGERRELL